MRAVIAALGGSSFCEIHFCGISLLILFSLTFVACSATSSMTANPHLADHPYDPHPALVSIYAAGADHLVAD